MGDFKRSASKVWWASESLEWREISNSPGSQDSGFSDTETSIHENHKLSKTDQNANPKLTQFEKQSPSAEKSANLTSNYKEKNTPDKNIHSKLHTESPKTSRFIKHSPKVSRSLFKNQQQQKESINNQYSNNVAEETTLSTSSSSTPDQSSIFNTNPASRTLPHFNQTEPKDANKLNQTAPAVLQELRDEEDISFNSLSSDCESELECLFNGPLDSPKHTSTPKTSLNMRRRRSSRGPLKLCFKARVPPEPISNGAVSQWMEQMRQHYETECMTTLQAKSIAGDLNHKVYQLATCTTATLHNVLKHSNYIQEEYKSLNSEKRHIAPLAQSLAGNILNFLQTFAGNLFEPSACQKYDNLRKADSDDTLKLVLDLFNHWQTIHHEVLLREVRNLVHKLEHPRSELDLRATVTGITSTLLRNEALIELFTKNDAVTTLLILCEKCEGSSMRALLLRALSTLCSTTFAVRQFEKYSGMQIVCDTLAEGRARPEPERAEAAALLAQVTAPWIEDNHCVQGLHAFSGRLVAALTDFAQGTRCCQNLLLCAAALANLSTMDANCAGHMLAAGAVEGLLEAVGRRGTCASVYLLEQVATLVANLAAGEAARRRLTEVGAAGVLVRFVAACGGGGGDEGVGMRLQQKAMIALSRLCGGREAALQVVEVGGVERMVKMCRERKERHDNDAILIATLATLRKISDACGSGVIGVEDAQELVEPKLLDSFLAYSSQSESYV